MAATSSEAAAAAAAASAPDGELTAPVAATPAAATPAAAPPTPAAAEGAAAAVSRALEWWSSFDLSLQRGQLVGQQADISRHMAAGVPALKHLVERTKEFRRGADADKLAGLEDMLGAFQEEVSSLNKRARFAERAFLQLVAALAEAPDPAPLLRVARDATRAAARAGDDVERLRGEVAERRAAAAASADAAVEVERLRGEVRALEAELAKLQNQDITIRDLAARLSELDAEVEAQVAVRLAGREADMRRVFEAELERVREGETAAEARLLALQRSLDDTVAGRDSAEAALLAASTRGGGSGGGGGSNGGGSNEFGSRRGGRVGDDGGDGGSSGGGGGSDMARMSVELEAAVSENERLAVANAGLTAELATVKRRFAATVAAAVGGTTASSSSSDGSFVGGDPWGAIKSALDEHKARAEAAEAEAARLSGAVAELQAESSRWQATLEAQRAGFEDAAERARERAAARDAELEHVRAELRVRPTTAEVAHLRQQYTLLQAAAFSTSMVGGEGGIGSGGGGDDGALDAVGGEIGGGVHTLLLRRNRALEARVLAAGAEVDAAKREAAEAGSRLADATAVITSLRAQVERLEDLIGNAAAAGAGAGAGAAAAGASGSGGGATARSPTSPRGGFTGRGGLPDTPTTASLSADAQLATVLLHAAPDTAAAAAALQPSTAGSTSAADASAVTDVLLSQRDRFRLRILELENEVAARTAALADSAARVHQLTSDNVRLYEKMRYLQTFAGSVDSSAAVGAGAGLPASAAGSASASGVGASAASAAGGGVTGPAALRSRGGGGGGGGGGGDDDLERVYKKLYNEANDPFADFARREKAQQYERLSAAERITLSSSRFFLSSKMARTFLFFYVLVMHLLVFATLWHFTNVSHRGCTGGGGDDEHGDHGVNSGLSRLIPVHLRGGGAGAAGPVVPPG